MTKYNDKIKSIEYMGEMDCVDIEVSDDHLFYGNGILTKNSVGISSTADSIFILGINEDKWVYESEIHFKVTKNRLGGRISEYGKFYIDKKSLKMYDDSEFDLWIEDAKVSEDERVRNKTKEIRND